MTRIRPAALLLMGLALSYAAPSRISAQDLLVRVHDAVSGRPVQGVLVAVESGAGEQIASALTDARGLFLFAGLAPGSYAVRAEMIGYGSIFRDDVTVVSDRATTLELPMEQVAIQLQGLSVEGEERCRIRPEEGEAVAQVWGEVRKALEAARWTEERGIYRYRVRRYSRDVEEKTGKVVRQASRRATLYLASPYASRPAEDLMENGFIQEPKDGKPGDLYFAPDAAVLLSDIFLDTHCMRLRAGQGENAGLLGLSFQPVRGRRVPDISGTLWLDPERWELVRLDFWYENIPTVADLHDVGGEVRFQRLPNGTWVIPEWKIRMPWLGAYVDVTGVRRVVQVGFREEGGTILRAQRPGGEVVLTAGTATVEGVILLEEGADPVAGARVALVGTADTVVTGSDGAFRFTELVPGRYEVAFSHPELDAWGYVPPPAPVEGEKGRVTSVQLTLPSTATLLALSCREEEGERPERSAVLVGRVTDSDTGEPVSGVQVLIEWEKTGFSARSDGRKTGEGAAAGAEMRWMYRVSSQGKGVVAMTDADGYYRACAVPRNTRVQLSARWGPFNAMADTLRISDEDPVRREDLVILMGEPTRVNGRVVAWRDGRAVSGARVAVTSAAPDAGTVELPPAVSDESGNFRLGAVPSGRYLLSVSAEGFVPLRDTVEVLSGRDNHLEVQLPRPAMETDGVVVTVEPRIPALEEVGFYQRRQEGSGVFLDRDDLNARGGTTLSDFLKNRPGIKVVALPGQISQRVRVTLTNGCLPAVYLDGTRVRRAGPAGGGLRTGANLEYLDDIASPSRVLGMEIYRSEAELPIRYTGTGAGCGVILIWSR
ncbi:MAG: carboxypeptidase regulatory-like domain-containing protein [Gemmatimonadota bacterium]